MPCIPDAPIFLRRTVLGSSLTPEQAGVPAMPATGAARFLAKRRCGNDALIIGTVVI